MENCSKCQNKSSSLQLITNTYRNFNSCTLCSRVDRTENNSEEKDGSHFWAIFELEKGYSADVVERIQGAKKKYLQSEMAAKAVEKSADTTWQKLLSAEKNHIGNYLPTSAVREPEYLD